MVNAVFVGLDRAGKTSIKLFLQYLDSERASKTVASTGVERLSRAGLTISIIPGQKVYRLNEDFYRILFPSADYIVFVVDAARPERLPEVREYFKFIKKMRSKYAVKKPKIILLAHKQDIEGALSGEEIKNAVAGSKSKILVLETSIHDTLSMLVLLRSLYNTLRGNYIDFISQALLDRLGAEAIAIYDSQSLPISIAGKKDLVEKIYEQYFDILFKDPNFKFGLLNMNGTKLAIQTENMNGCSITILAANFKTSVEETLKILKDAAQSYMREFAKRWRNLPSDPWNF